MLRPAGGHSAIFAEEVELAVDCLPAGTLSTRRLVVFPLAVIVVPTGNHVPVLVETVGCAVDLLDDALRVGLSVFVLVPPSVSVVLPLALLGLSGGLSAGRAGLGTRRAGLSAGGAGLGTRRAGLGTRRAGLGSNRAGCSGAWSIVSVRWQDNASGDNGSAQRCNGCAAKVGGTHIVSSREGW